MEISTGKFGKFEITSVRNHKGEGKPTEEQIDKIHTVPNIIVTGNYKQDGVDVFVAESIIGVIHIKTSDNELIKLFNDGQKDNVAVNLFQAFNPITNNQSNVISTDRTDGFLISELDFGIVLSDIQLAKLKASPYAIITEIDRFDMVAGVFATSFDLETSIGKYVVVVLNEDIAVKLATAFVTGKSVDLFEKLEG